MLASSSTSTRGPNTLRLLLALSGTTLGLLIAVVFLLSRTPGSNPQALLELALSSDEIRSAAMNELVARGDGVWDSFSDPDVGRVMQRNVKEREFRGVPVSSNEFGMRERPYELVKPSGVTRVALLGDSFVFGYKVAAEERLGVFLESYLNERKAGEQQVECLHLGISSWNVQAECAYLRRQLHLLKPDLVVQIVVVNDLDDLQGVRGFGAMGGFSPQFRQRANGTFTMMSPASLWPRRVQNFLLDALDEISRERYRRAASEIERLARAVELSGGRYLLLIAWDSFNPMARKYLAPSLPDEQVAFVSRTFTEDLRFRIDRGDRHWNPAGHERMAKLLYGLITERDLLAALQPKAWDVATRVVAEVHHPGVAEAGFVERYEQALRARAREQIEPTIELAKLKQLSAKQVYGGVDAQGHVAPYAAMILANRSAGSLKVSGRRHPAELLDGATARIFVDEIEVGSLPLAGDLRFQEEYPLPPELGARPFVSVRFEASDYVLVDVTRGTCSAFILERIELW